MKTVTTLLKISLFCVGASLGAQASAIDLAGFGGRFAVKVTSLKEARFKATTPQQYDFSCGSAAVATLLTHQYGYPITEQTVFEEMFQRGDQAKIRREGFSLLDMKTFLEAHQFQANGFAFPLAQLLASGLPAIVLIADNGYRHFVVVKGLRGERILIGDPASGTRAVALAKFESIWVNKLLFVIQNKQDQAKFNTETDWQAAPSAPLTAGINVEGLGALTIGKFGPGDF
jgi:predicted double-glycine peptidase